MDKLAFLQWRRLVRRLIIGMAAALCLLWMVAYIGGAGWLEWFEAFDHWAEQGMMRLRTPEWTKLALVITLFGSGLGELAVLAVGTPILAFVMKRRREASLWIITFCGAWVLNFALKAVFRRSRPEWEHLAEAGGYSFPSGHAMVSLVFYGMLAYWLWVHFREAGRYPWAVVSVVALVSFIVLIGVSRVYLGVHFASDVAAGFAAGGVWLYVCLRELKRLAADQCGGQ